LIDNAVAPEIPTTSNVIEDNGVPIEFLNTGCSSQQPLVIQTIPSKADEGNVFLYFLVIFEIHKAFNFLVTIYPTVKLQTDVMYISVFQRTVLECLQHLKQEIDVISAKVGALVAVKDLQDEGNAFEFPISTDLNFEEFESRLVDPNIKIKLVNCV